MIENHKKGEKVLFDGRLYTIAEVGRDEFNEYIIIRTPNEKLSYTLRSDKNLKKVKESRGIDKW